MRTAATLLLLLTWDSAVVAQSYAPGEKIEYKDTSVYPNKWEPGTFVKMLPGSSQALIRKKPSQFFPEGSESAIALTDVRKPQPAGTAPAAPAAAPASPAVAAPAPIPAAPATPAKPGTPPPAAASTGLLSKERILSIARQWMGPDPWQNPARESVLEKIREYIKANGTDFQPDLDFSNRMGAQGTYSVHIGYAAAANFGPAPAPESYFGTFLLRAANRGSRSVSNQGGRVVVTTTDSQAESGRLTIRADGSYEWDTQRNGANVIRGSWRWARPDEMLVWEGGPALWLLKAKQNEDYMVRGDREPGYAGWIDVGMGKGRTPVEYGRRQ